MHGLNLKFLNKTSFRQLIRFGMVGLSNTIVGYTIYCIFLTIFRKTGLFPDIDYLVSQALEFILGVLWSFYWNNRLVFVEKRTKRQLLAALLKAYVMYIFTGLLLSGALLILWVRIFEVSAYLGPILNIFITVPLNFLLSKFWVYRKNK